MDLVERIDGALRAALVKGLGEGCPPRLAAAIRHAVFPGGARIRPRLCLAVAMACGDDAPAVSAAAAASIELLHCASLTHDDLPCFDDADTRRGRASVQRAYGERLAVLAGDGLIVLAFENLAWHTALVSERLGALITIIGRATGAGSGIVAGQAWESEPRVVLADYHQEKTAALFIASTEAGAAAAGEDPAPWRGLGQHLGLAYQVADDIRDVASRPEDLGKPTGQDAVHGRPSAAAELGLNGAIERLGDLVRGAIASVPDCPGAADLQAMIRTEMRRMLPKAIAARVV